MLEGEATGFAFPRNSVMSTPSTIITPLRQRMIEDMRVRQPSPKTQQHYIHAVRRFTAFLGRSSDTGDAEGVDGLCQTPICRTPGGTCLPVTLHPSGSHFQ